MNIKDAKWEKTDTAVGMKPKFRVWCKECFWAYVERVIKKDMVSEDYDDSVEFSHDIGFIPAFEDAINEMLRGTFDMVLRECFCSPLKNISDTAFHNDMQYKCAHSDGCDGVKVFGVPIDKAYYVELMRRRKGKARILPRKDWNEDEDIKKQLKSMGYI